MNLGHDGRDGRGGDDLSALGEGQYVMMLHSLITQFVQWCSQPLSHQIFPRPLLHFCLQLITRPPSQRWPLCWRWGQRRQSYSPPASLRIQRTVQGAYSQSRGQTIRPASLWKRGGKSSTFIYSCTW